MVEETPKKKSSYKGRYRTVMRKGTVRDLITDGLGDLEGLREEMTTWRDNMSSTTAANTTKFQTVEETADALENMDLEQTPEGNIPENLMDIEAEWPELVVRSGRAGPSRSTRASNACNRISVAIEVLEGITKAAEATSHELATEEREQIEAYIEELEQLVDEVGNLEFPGMYN